MCLLFSWVTACQDWLHNLQGSEQNENAWPRVQKHQEFQDSDIRALNQAHGALQLHSHRPIMLALLSVLGQLERGGTKAPFVVGLKLISLFFPSESKWPMWAYFPGVWEPGDWEYEVSDTPTSEGRWRESGLEQSNPINQSIWSVHRKSSQL